MQWRCRLTTPLLPPVCVVGDYFYLYFREWDGPGGRATVALARATRASGGVPGSWHKWFNVRLGSVF